MLHRGMKGFTLVELLVVVAIIGIIAAIAIPALQTAIDKSKQRASMANMRGVATGIQMYQVDQSIFPADGTTASDLVTLLMTHTKVMLPATDGWAHDWGYHSDSSSWYSLESFGKDGVDGADITGATAFQFSLDIIYATGRFANAPE